jgi:alkanesulfonate monooxygenase SsuD/methylene tetrahydromethanopterin reductase-like flavin-dependent oxidoreductase (luciferase family)
MTLDHVSGGRLTLGLGAGGVGFDATVLGETVPTPGERASRLAEFVEVVDRVLRSPAGASYAGEWYSVDEARMLPGCVQQPRLPLAIAAGGRRTLGLVARYADAWITYGDADYRDTTPAGVDRAVRSQFSVLSAACEAIGRDAGEIDRIYLIGNTDERPLASVEAFVDFAGRFAELGFTDLVFHHPRPDDPVWTEPEQIVEKLAESALPQIR